MGIRRFVSRELKPAGVRISIDIYIDRDLSDPLVANLRRYVEEAVESWEGQRRPEDRMIDNTNAKVTHLLDRSKGRWRKTQTDFTEF